MNKAKKLILVVDDEQAILDMLKLILTDEGYDVATTIDGAALKIAPEIKPDLILLDIMMPGMDGIEVSRGLKADPLTKNIPIILMTADSFDLAKGAKHVDHFLLKPFDLDQLLTAIEQFI